LSKTAKITETARKQLVRQALDHFELSQGDRNYHFLIHKPLGATLQLISRRSLPIYYVQDLTYQMLHALECIHGAQVIHGGPTLSLLHSVI
jgi:hypothetical protein